MNYLEVNRTGWHAILGECPSFVRRRIECLIKAGYLTPSGGDRFRTSYRVTGGANEYAAGADELLKASL